MKIKNGFILRKVGRQYVVAATGEASKNFNGMIRLDESGAFAFELLRNEITEQEMHRLTTADETWLVDCVAALAAESILRSEGEGQKKLGSMIDQLEHELKAELEAMEGGGMTDESG